MIAPRRNEFSRYLRTETFGGIILIIAAAVALVWINSPFGDSYEALRDTKIGTDFGFLKIQLTVGHWASEGLLAVFFYVAGLELKRELVVGELSTRKQAMLPALAAVGGVIVPAAIALGIGWGTPGIEQAWAVPVATDIAFALGILALVGSRVPATARVFLLALAVVDDLIAIAIIAFVFTSTIDMMYLGVAAVGLAVYFFLQRQRVRSAFIYVPLALIVFVAVLNSGIHATVAGVLLGLLTRVRTDPNEDEAPATRMEHLLQPWSAAVCVPLFALFSSGVPINARVVSEMFTDRITLGIMGGLLFGKVIGIFGTSWVAIKLGLGQKPAGLHYRDLFAVSILGAIGFTVSLLIAELALGNDADLAKGAVLLTSMAASLLGALALIRRGRVHRRLLEQD